MNIAKVWWNEASQETEGEAVYDLATESFTVKGRGAALAKADTLFINWQARCQWQLKDIPCRPDGLGLDLKTHLLAEELKAERDAQAVRSPAYVAWRDQYILDAASGPTLAELKTKYPNAPL